MPTPTYYHDQDEQLRHNYLGQRGLAVAWHNEILKLKPMGNLKNNTVFKNAKRKDNFNAKNLGANIL